MRTFELPCTGLTVGLLVASLLSGCSQAPPSTADTTTANTTSASGTADTGLADVAVSPLSPQAAAVQQSLEGVSGVRLTIQDGKLTEIVIQDGSNIQPSDLDLIGQVGELKKLQIFNCRVLNDEMVAKLSALENLNSLALTNTVIGDASVALIAQSFPKLVELDLSSNTNLTHNAMKSIAELTDLKTLALVQNRFNDLSTRRLKSLQNLTLLDLRGNMEAGNMTLGVVAQLPKLITFKHRSTAVTDEGVEQLADNQSLQNLLIQDFMITSLSGEHLARLSNLKQLEVFRCQAMTGEGIVALQGLGLERLTLRDLPAVDDAGLEVLTDLPKLKRLYLHELEAVTDYGLANLSHLSSLEVLDIWSVPQLSDATVDVIAELPNLKELTLRATAITDASVAKLTALPKLKSLILKENSQVTESK